MSTLTPNYNLTKADNLENYDVGVVNANLDTIDTELKGVQDQVTALDTEVTKPPLCVIMASATQSIPDATATKVQLGATPEVIFGCTYSAATDDITITKAGVYLITGSVGYSGNATGLRYATIEVNATGVVTAGTPGETGGFPTAQVTSMRKLNINDKVTLATTQFSGGALNTAVGADRTRLEVLWVSDLP